MPEEIPKNDEGNLELEVKRIIEVDDCDELKRKNLERIKKINEYKREFAIYSVLGCADTFITSNFLMASTVPITFGNLSYSGALIGAAVVNAVISYYLFRTAGNKLELLIEEKNRSN